MSRNIINSHKIRKFLEGHPDLDIIVFTGAQACNEEYYWTCCTDIKAEVGEVLNCDGPNDEVIYTDRDQLRDDVENILYDENGTEENLKKLVDAKMAEYEPYWKDVIIVYVDN